jgi:NADPH:quinone reductase-like Zn-dependent oxidoreductase
MHTMYAVRAHARGGPEQLAYEEAPRPEPRVGEALIRIHAAGITPTELGWDETWVDRAGHPRVPTIPSHEVAGVVEAVGHGVVHVSIGDAVYGLIEFDHDGAAAEYVALRARDLARQPVSAGHVKAAAMPLSGLTAWQALVEQARVAAGMRVLIHGGAGGVGSFAVQLARTLGAEVYATAGTRDVDFVRSLGAQTVIDYRTQRFEEIAHGLDVVVDTVGGETQVRSFRSLRRGGVLVTVAAPPPADLAREHGVRAVFFIVEPDRAQLLELSRLVDEGRLRAEVARVFPLSRAREAYEFGLTSHPRGKVVLQIDGGTQRGDRTGGLQAPR